MAAGDHVTTIEVPLVINLAAAGAGGLLGTLRAGQKEKLDLVGVLFVAFAVGFGGGVIRDLLLGSLPPASFQSPWYIAVVGLAAMAGSLFLWTLHRIRGLLFVTDAFTIGLFAVVGTNKAILYHLGFLPAVLIGILASVGGSILADILMGETPSTLVAGPPNAVAAAVGASGAACPASPADASAGQPPMPRFGTPTGPLRTGRRRAAFAMSQVKTMTRLWNLQAFKLLYV
jgi:uncharacterized membrane protein YeiH